MQAFSSSDDVMFSPCRPSIVWLCCDSQKDLLLFLALRHNDEKIHEADNRIANLTRATSRHQSFVAVLVVAPCFIINTTKTLVDSKSRLLRLTSSLISILRNICCRSCQNLIFPLVEFLSQKIFHQPCLLLP